MLTMKTAPRLDAWAEKKVKRKGSIRVYTRGILGYFLERGWQIASHTPTSYGASQSWDLVPPAR